MSNCAIGIDLGGTKTKVALVDNFGAILRSKEIPTQPSEGISSFINRVVPVIKEVTGKNNPQSIGVGIAGQIEPTTGLILFAPNLNWRNIPIKNQLMQELKLPVFIINDVKAITIGEWQFGAGKGCPNLVCIFFGTGIGAGIVIDNRLILGPNQTAGELGHTIIDLNGPKCTCGNWGCWEVHAAGWAIAKKAQDAVKEDRRAGQLLLEKSADNIDSITAKMVTESALEGDPLAQLLVSEATEAIALGCVSVVNALNPSRLIIGGGLLKGMQGLLVHIEKAIEKRALAAARNGLQVLPAQLGSDAGVIGAAYYSLQSLN